MFERNIERFMLASRWLLAPVYLGLSLVLLALVVKFYQEIVHLLPNILSIREVDLILMTLSLIDLVLVAGLLVMVMYSSYENFVGELSVEKNDRLAWLTKMDAGSLKLKVAAAIVAISSIHLLKAFMNIEQIANDKLMWYVIIHMTFVLSALLMGLLDYIGRKDKSTATELGL